MNKQLKVLTLIAAMGLSGAANAALLDRGGGLIYDTDLNVTWLQDANYAKTSSYDADGLMNWNEAMTWAANLSYYDSVRNVTYTDWRLPTVIDTGSPGCDLGLSGTDCGYNVNTASGEMAHLFYDELGNLAKFVSTGPFGVPQEGWGLVNKGPFTNFQSNNPYWYGTEHEPNTALGAWQFYFHEGSQDSADKYISFSALAVRPGDVAAVPVPAAVWLFGSGLMGLIGVTRRKISHRGW